MAVTTNGENHPFLYRNGRMIDLGTLGSSDNDWWNVASGINNSGVVTERPTTLKEISSASSGKTER